MDGEVRRGRNGRYRRYVRFGRYVRYGSYGGERRGEGGMGGREMGRWRDGEMGCRGVGKVGMEGTYEF